MSRKRLTHTQVSSAKPKERLYRLFDGGGLCLKITAAGSKIWEYRFKNPDTNKDDTIIIGSYGDISLADAREKHQELRKIVSMGINPKNRNTNKSFPNIYELWFSHWQEGVSAKHAQNSKSLIDRHAMKYLSHMNVDDIKAVHIVSVLREIEKTGSLSQIRRLKSRLNQIFRFAISSGLCEHNPTSIITLDIFKKHEEEAHDSLSLNEIYLLNDLFKNDSINITTRNAIEMILRSMLRLQEVILMRFDYIEGDVIRLPAEIMKNREEHLVPITPQIQKIIDKQKNKSPFIFPDNEKEPLKKHTPNYTLNKFGIASTIHGFRHLASTILNESLLFHPDIIEASLAHKDRNKIRGTYNLAKYIERRRELLQWWSDFIDKCDTKENNGRALKNQGISLI